MKALLDSGLGELIESLPEGLNTKVGERGSLLSGGQKQRLSLARAILKDAPIFILDEASSALDPITETKINEAVLKTGKKQTILIISHRLSTVLSADKIIVLENGTIVKKGHTRIYFVIGMVSIQGCLEGNLKSEKKPLMIQKPR